MTEDGALLRLDLPDRAAAPAAARKAVTALNGYLNLVSEARVRDVQLLVTELVANAIRHGGADSKPVRVVVRATPAAMRVEVSDDGDGFGPDELDRPSLQRAGGWGLEIVAALAHRWGVDRSRRTMVWFEIDRPQRDAPLPVEPCGPDG